MLKFSASYKLFFSRFVNALLIFLIAALILPLNIFSSSNIQYPVPTAGEIDKAVEKIPVGRFLPDQPLYFLISLKETFTRLVQPSAAQRSEFDFILAGKRLKEAYLLGKKGNNHQASSNLIKYQKRLAAMTNQLEKARSQHQDIAKIVGNISDQFAYQERLILAIIADGNIDKMSIDAAIAGFQNGVDEINKINPGVKDRFQILKLEKTAESPQPQPSPSPAVSHFPPASTPSSSPRRIIY